MSVMHRALRRVFRAFESERTEEPERSVWNLTVEVEEDELDGGWVASCAEFPGCYSQGETEEEALENLVDALGGVMQVRLAATLAEGNHPAEGHRHNIAL